MYPAAQALWARWAPPNERSRLLGFSYAGSVGFLWCCAWTLFAHDTPDDDKTITDIERKYINYSIGERTKSKAAPPWKAILTSTAVWAIVVGHTCGNYGAYMLLTKIPAYMKEVLKFDIKSNGVFSMLPYLTFWLFITVSGTIADLLISRDVLSIEATRKLMSCIGTFGPSAFLIGTGFMECDQQVGAVIMLTISVGLCGFHFSGFFINHGDIAPAFAGTLFGISNTFATIPGILSPYIVSAMTKKGTRQQWQNTFYVAAGVYCFGAIWYLIFGKGEIQPWAQADKEEDAKTGNGTDDRVGFDLHEIHEEDETHDLNEEEEEDEEEKDKDDRLLPPASTRSKENSPEQNV
ncbi:vesicular glutamate transporter 1 [Plakobranchus ocellatus]|uniref:Vesicular glutamate transporter 1 n=1 Tax=Plakobranchus ocellatus TaxID=259542 RepID=A0AAV4AVT9_9GAST|nr:vesicular glutamate transporter 1 [Plakobranchus ocellatus]